MDEIETLVWGGPGHTQARTDSVKSALVETLKKAGHNYALAGERKTDQGMVSLFVTGRTGATGAILGSWIAGDTFLLLSWGKMTKAAVPPAADTETAPAAAPAQRAVPVIAPPASGKLPAALIGSWGFTTISGTTYWDRSTGAYLGGGTGGSQTYTFLPGGRYKLFNYVRSRNTGWQLETLTWEEGTVSVEGDSLVLQPTSGKYKVMDNRVARNNYERPMKGEELKKNARTFVWSMAKDSRTGRPALLLGASRDKLVQYVRPEGE